MLMLLVLEPHFDNHHIKPAEPAAIKHWNQIIIPSVFYSLFSMNLKNTSCWEGRKYAKQVNVSLHLAFLFNTVNWSGAYLALAYIICWGRFSKGKT